MPSVQLSRRGKIALGIVAGLIVFLILAASLVNVYTDYLWFGEVGFRGVFSTILRVRVILFFAVGIFMAGVIGGNIMLAYRLRPPFRPMSPEQQNLERYRIAIEPRKRLAFIALVVLIGLIGGSSGQRGWKTWLLWFNGGSFGQTDPQFHLDLSFYAWDYPLYRTVLGVGYAVVIFSILASAVVYYLYGALRLQTPGPKITISARRHLTVLVFLFIVLKAMSYWLDRYGLVFSSRGKVNGASYTDVNATLPAKTILFWVALIIAVGVLASIWLSSPTIPAVSFAVLLVMSIVISGIYPALVQQITVKPNASVKEAKYISRNILATRQAYGISSNTDGGPVSYESYPATSTATEAQLTGTANAATIDNIRLLDPNVVSPTFNARQQLRNVYGFPDKLDVDRYTTNTLTQDYIVGVRELKAANLSANGASNQTTWINQHTVFTHGYGLVAANADKSVNTADDFAEGSIPPTGFLTINQPEVYYGELGVDYSIVGASGTAREFNGSDQTKTTYAGKGGIKLSNPLTRAAFAIKYGQVNFLLNDTVSANGAKIIFDRNPRQRVLKVAPYLHVDGDPYPAVVNGRIVWIMDGYTTMANYPYSEKNQLSNLTTDSLTSANRTVAQPDATFNYIRNSVKATVDAYDGTVHLYQWDQQDPILKAWMKIFPGTVEPKSAMPVDVLAHVRYPQDLFEVQRALLAQYHVTDPVQFYNASDQWTVPTDPYLTGEQPPYYVLSAPPLGGTSAEFQLTSPMKVNSRENLASFISVDSDSGPNYGKFTVLTLPTSSTVPGPTQLANTFKTEPVISKDLSLLGGGGSVVIHGNLLTLPIGKGFLYVEPLYVQGTGDSSFPLLQRVIVSYGDRIGYAATLSEALNNLGQTQVGQSLNGTGGTNPTSTPTSSPPSTSSPPTTGTVTGGNAPTGNAAIDAVLKQIDTAGAALSAAYKSGDVQAIGQAQADLKRLADQYLALRAQQTAAPTKSPSATPTK